jgi:hypothetical protein
MYAEKKLIQAPGPVYFLSNKNETEFRSAVTLAASH